MTYNIGTCFRSSKFLVTNIYVEALSCVYDVYTTPTVSVGSMVPPKMVLQEPFLLNHDLHKRT